MKADATEPNDPADPLPIVPTAASVARLYASMETRLAVARRRLGRPLTLADKLLLAHLDDPDAGELVVGESYLSLRPDRVVFQDVLGQTAFLQLLQTGRSRLAVPTTIHCDHLVQARTDGLSDLRASEHENGEVYAFLRSAAAKYGAGFWRPGAGIIHQVVLETYAFPGQLIIGTDSHTPNAGGLGACAIGVGGAEAVEVIAGLPWELLYPRRIAVRLRGSLRGWTAPKDVILHVAGVLGVAGATNAIVEYIGPGAASISATGKATITNMGAELGATTSLFAADESMLRYLRATDRATLAPVVERHFGLLAPDAAVLEAPEAYYERVIDIDLTALEPHVVGPHSPDRARPLSALAAEVRDPTNGFVDAISAALLGSCTNSSYEDMARAADVAAQAAARGLGARSKLYVTPGSERVRATIERDGQLAPLVSAGAVVLASACGPCIGQWRRSDGSEPNTIVTSYNRNFAGRNDGRVTTMSFIASPEIVTALCIAGRLSFDPRTEALTGPDGQPFRFEPPAQAADVPPGGFVHSDRDYIAPPSSGEGVEIAIDAASQRLQRLTPWPAWDGRDLVGLPLLVKTQGKTTTDQISPAGEWLRLRGHLERFSDNLLSGANDAAGGAPGTAKDPVTGERRPISVIARAHRARAVRWVIVGDRNYGEGSSREHAALSPRLLGCAAVIARSFARIHESNLKKQGLLALTFSDPADYDRVREGDRLDLLDLDALAPGRAVRCVIHHDEGGEEEIVLRHTYGAKQIAWFREGSALNAHAMR